MPHHKRSAPFAVQAMRKGFIIRQEVTFMDFSSLGFGYIKAPYRYVCKYKDGQWGEGYLTEDDTIVLSESACVLQYAQTCFEGLKAYRTANDDIVCFRPDLNAARLVSSCKRMVMPPFPEDKFLEAVKTVVMANKDMVPPYGTGGSLYVRPFMIGTDPILPVKPSGEFEFRIFVSPVGPYFKNGIKPLTLRIADYDRAAPHGTGNIKAGLNYAMSLYPTVEAHEEGYDENVYLDPGSRTYIEETGGANILFITKDRKIVTSKSDSILPSITKRSILQVAQERLGLTVEERKINVSEISSFVECGLCGTAAVICPVGKIVDQSHQPVFSADMDKAGEVTMKLYNALLDIQLGRAEAPEGWIFTVGK